MGTCLTKGSGACGTCRYGGTTLTPGNGTCGTRGYAGTSLPGYPWVVTCGKLTSQVVTCLVVVRISKSPSLPLPAGNCLFLCLLQPSQWTLRSSPLVQNT